MPNTLIKDPLIGGTGSGNGGGSSGSSDGGGPGGSAVVPATPGSACYASAFERVVEQWPLHEVVYVESGGYFRVTDPGGDYVYHVTAQCSGGYVSLTYETVQIPGIQNG